MHPHHLVSLCKMASGDPRRVAFEVILQHHSLHGLLARKEAIVGGGDGGRFCGVIHTCEEGLGNKVECILYFYVVCPS